jgi:NAD-dependent SIR2 family protein deacetylase
VVTQNVDDLHLRAGTRGLVRLHGSLWELRCAGACGAPDWRDDRVPLPRVPPACPSCGGLARPAIVWFGEALADADVAAATRACDCEVFIAVGTSALVYPAAGFMHDAARRGALTAEINAEPTAQSSLVDIAIEGRAEEVLPALDRARG